MALLDHSLSALVDRLQDGFRPFRCAMKQAPGATDAMRHWAALRRRGKRKKKGICDFAMAALELLRRCRTERMLSDADQKDQPTMC